MQSPTQNAISQVKHGAYNAVDFRSVPDVFYYAPEDGTISTINRNNGDCGYSFKLVGASGQHGFCHNEEVYVTSGQTVKRGQRLAKMGYTGKTDPVGPGGRHLHWILNRGGAWVYPPDYVNESFIKEGEVIMADIKVVGAPSSVSWGSGRIDVFARGTDDSLWHKWFDESGWHDWERLGGGVHSSPDVSSWAEGRLDVFNTGIAGDLMHWWFDEKGWHPAESLGIIKKG